MAPREETWKQVLTGLGSRLIQIFDIYGGNQPSEVQGNSKNVFDKWY